MAKRKNKLIIQFKYQKKIKMKMMMTIKKSLKFISMKKFKAIIIN